MAGKLGKSSKQILSILFHLVVLVGMVVAYDLSKGVFTKLHTTYLTSAEDKAAAKEEAEEAKKEPSITRY